MNEFPDLKRCKTTMVLFRLRIVFLLLTVLHITQAFNEGIGKRWLSASLVDYDALSTDQWMQLYRKITLSDEEEDEEDEDDDEGIEESISSASAEKVQQVEGLSGAISKYVQIAPIDDEFKETCFVLNGKIYSKSDDSFYFKTSELDAQALVPDFDVLKDREIAIGTNASAPIVVLYGCETDLEFADFNRNLYNEAKFGKIRMTWRPTCIIGDTPEYALSATLSDKNWDQKANVHLVIDDSDLKIKDPVKLKYLDQKELEDLDMKFTALLLEKFNEDHDFDSFFEYFKSLSYNFPAVAPVIASEDNIDTTPAKNIVKDFNKRKISHELLGLYINGQQWRLSELDETTLPAILAKEWSRVNDLKEKLSKFPGAELENFLKYFTVGYSYTAYFDKNRYDFYRTPGFSETVVFFNNFEKDELYKDLPEDNMAFLEPSDFEPIPSIKQNWNELIFFINFDDMTQFKDDGAVGSLLQAIDQMETGYPIRLGLIPFSSSGSNSVVDMIYKLKSESDKPLQSIIDYLRTLIGHSEKIQPQTKHKGSAYDEYLERFKIADTCIAMNGVLLPFQAKAWKIHTSRILSADIEYLKSELQALGDSSNLSVRQLLHHRSLTLKNPVYIPNRMLDETFTRVNNRALHVLGSRTIIFSDPNQKTSPIHTITLVDDFNSYSAVQKIRALLRNNHKSVSFRLVHVGDLSKSWDNFKMEFSTGKLSGKIASKTTVNFIVDPFLNVLSSWLPDISIKALRKPFAVINGKFFNTDDDLYSVELWHNILVHHSSRTLDVLKTLHHIGALDENIMNPSAIEELTAAVIKYVHHGYLVLNNGIPYTTESSMPRVSLSELEEYTITSRSDQSVINVTLLLDPVEERTQRLLYLSSLLKDLPFVKTEVALVPTANLTLNPVHRFYNASTGISDNGFLSEFDYPHNINPDDKSIIIEAHVFDEGDDVSIDTIDGLAGVCLQLMDNAGNFIDKGLSMKSFGYVQLSLPSLQKGLKLESCDSSYEITALSTMAEANYIEVESFDVDNSLPTQIHVKVRKTTAEIMNEKDDRVNVMVVVHDGQESVAVKRIERVKKEIGDKAKFYILAQRPKLIVREMPASVDYHLLTYTWPLWLRPQRFSAKELEAKSILLLDTMVPKNVDYLVVLSLTDDSSDTIPWNDIASFSDAVFYLKPAKTKEGSYWNFGYWKKYLQKYDLPFYDLSSSYIINMKKWREIDAGTSLRLHYHLLSKSFISLNNFRADLVNSIQLKVPIAPLEEHTDELFEQDEL